MPVEGEDRCQSLGGGTPKEGEEMQGCSHDGTATGYLRFSKTDGGKLEGFLRCDACEVELRRFDPMPYVGGVVGIKSEVVRIAA